jgi:hypothetical protein
VKEQVTVPVRRQANEVPQITGIRLLPQGAEASLLNISSSGLLAETADRVPAGSAVEVCFEGSFSPARATGRVVRSQVSFMNADGRLRYQVAIEFDTPIALDDQPAATPAKTTPRDVRNRW